MQTRDKVFISYSHDDKNSLKELQKHLAPYINNDLITVWDDTQIRPGARWKESIERALASAKVAVLLVSPDFLYSRFIAEHELQPLLEAARNQGVVILWVPIRASSFEETAIADYQSVHPPKKPLASLRRGARDDAWVNICKAIQREYRRLWRTVLTGLQVRTNPGR